MNKSLLKYTYLIVALLNLFSWAWMDGEYNMYTKPLLMPLLMLYMYESSKGGVILSTLLLFLALVFSWVGDLALMYEEYFLLGVGAFFIAQVLYVIIFIKGGSVPYQISWVKIITVGLYGISFLYILLPHAGDLQIPIVIYGISLMAMVATASMRDINSPDRSYLLVAIGAVFFLISDTMIAVDKFVNTIPMGDILIMSTYLIAQYLIVEGLIREQQYANLQTSENQ